MNEVIEVGRKSWVAWLKTGLAHALGIALSLWLALEQSPGWLGLSMALLVYAAYRLAVLRTWRLCAVEEGILLMHGLLPWDRKAITIRWADVGTVTCQTGLWSWLSRSHLVMVSHRFTLERVIVFSDLWMGPAAVALLTHIQTGRLRGEALAIAASVSVIGSRKGHRRSEFLSMSS
jgi:hypothetical protein